MDSNITNSDLMTLESVLLSTCLKFVVPEGITALT